MARKKASAPNIDLAAFDTPGVVVTDISMQDEIETSFLEYAVTVIYDRALPDARDGLKPVQRRIAYGMEELGLRPDKGFVKSARVVGDVMGKYHPHGDSAIYDAMVNLAQDFRMNAPLVLGHGNFGSPDDKAAASRYTEAKLSPQAMALLESIDEDTVDFKPNYSGDLEEPEVLPASFPNLLVNGTSGVAVGMACKFIPHNFTEVMQAARWLVKHPNAKLDKLMEFIPGPDLPGGGLVLGMDMVREAYETGQGIVRMRAKHTIGAVEGSRGRQSITFSELPYGVGPESVIEKIKSAISENKLQGIHDVKDLTDMQSGGTRLVVECKTGVNPSVLVASLFKYTPLEDSFGINNTAIVDGEPRVLGLKELLEVFLRHRYDVVRRRSAFRLSKKEARLHLVEGLIKALVDIDKVIKIIRGSENATAARDNLMSKFKLSEVQASYILDTPLRRLTKYDTLELEGEQDTLLDEIKRLKEILDNDSVLRDVVAEELAATMKKFDTPRRTTLVDGDLAQVVEETNAAAAPLTVADEGVAVLLSATGMLGRTAASSEEAQSMKARRSRSKHDQIIAMVDASTHGQFIAVTNKGRAFKVNTLDVPSFPNRSGIISLTGMVPAKELFTLAKGEHLVALAPAGEAAESGVGLAIGTRQGVVKVTKPDWPVRSDEFSVISLADGDEIIGAQWLDSDDGWFVFVTDNANLLRFEASKVRPQGLSGGGMAGVKLSDGAAALSFNVAEAEMADSLVILSTGPGVKATPLAEYPSKGRATGGVRCMRFLAKRDPEERLAFAWVGADAALGSKTGEPMDAPPVDRKRDGVGIDGEAPAIGGTLLVREF